MSHRACLWDVISKCSWHARAFVISLGMQEFHNLEYLSWKGPCTSFNLLLSVTDRRLMEGPIRGHAATEGQNLGCPHSCSIQDTWRGHRALVLVLGKDRGQQWWVRNIGGYWGASPLSVMTVNTPFIISTRILSSMEGEAV